jgi:hypothetical protein
MNLKYDELLCHRDELLEAAKLANLAYAHQWLGDFAGRVERSGLGLSGRVVLRGPDHEQGRTEPDLVAVDFSQAILEEHFLPEEIKELHAVLGFVHDTAEIVEARFHLREIGGVYVPALRRALQFLGALPMRPAAKAESGKLDAA